MASVFHGGAVRGVHDCPLHILLFGVRQINMDAADLEGRTSEKDDCKVLE